MGEGGDRKFYFCGALYQGPGSVQGPPTGGGMQGLHLHLLIIVNQLARGVASDTSGACPSTPKVEGVGEA